MWRSVLAVLVAALGFGGGLAYARYASPVEYTHTDLASLRVDFRADLVLMTAERFDRDHDVHGALGALAHLGPESPARKCAQALEFSRLAAYSPQDVELLEQLLSAVQEQTVRTPQPGVTP